MKQEKLSGVACEVELTESGEGSVLSVLVNVGEKGVFLDRPASVCESRTRAFINQVLSSPGLRICNLGALNMQGNRYTRIGVAESPDQKPTGAELEINGPIRPGLHSTEITDEGSSEKRSWRLQMMSLASEIFGKQDCADHQVVLMPGSSNLEWQLWQQLGFSVENMVMVEGDLHKCQLLQSRFLDLEHSPQFVSAYFGSGKGEFFGQVKDYLQDSDTAVLSLDTESTLSRKLYQDFVELLSLVQFKSDLFLALNVVSRRDNLSEIRDILAERPEFDTAEDDARKALLQALPNMAIKDLNRTDISLEKSQVFSYQGLAGSPMQCVFAHFKRS